MRFTPKLPIVIVDTLFQVENIFIEAKPYFIQSDDATTYSSAAKCWDTLEQRRQCCGNFGPDDWLSVYLTNSSNYRELIVF